ncbi:MAG: hypothetical protein PF636_09540, partial [Actinomycetota bacterium]|nr:hypothetical protein [Actinomycetota bacterium]
VEIIQGPPASHVVAPTVAPSQEQQWAADLPAQIAASASSAGSGPDPQPFEETPSRRARAPREPLAWTTVLTYVGAFLVIVAAAIFSIATWDIYSVGFKIAFLGGLTVAFYGVGEYVRTKLDLAGGGTALIAVSSAMLLFDGWIVIDGYHLSGPWPWMALLLLCAFAYYAVEIRLRGRWTGVIGAAAQLGWWWMMGQGLGWTTSSRMVGVAVIAALWAVAADRARDSQALGTLAQVLRVAAPVAVAISALGFMGDLVLAPAGAAQVIGAALIGVSGTVVLDRFDRRYAGFAGLGYLPLVMTSLNVLGDPQWSYVIIVLLVAVVAVVYEAFRGGFGHAIAAASLELLMWLLLAERLDLQSDVTVAVLGAVAVVWLLAGRLVERARNDDSLPGAEAISTVATYAGWALLAAVTLGMPIVRNAVPLSGVAIEMRDAVLALGVLAYWILAASLRRTSFAGFVAVGVSFWATAAVSAWLAPDWHSALYVSALVVVAGLWLHARGAVERFLGASRDILELAMVAVPAVFVLFGVFAASYYYDVREWETVFMFGSLAALWSSAALHDGHPALRTLSSAAWVGTASCAAWVAADSGAAAVAAAVSALLIVLSGALMRVTDRGWPEWWPAGAVAAGTILTVTASGYPDSLAFSLAIVAVTWVVLAWCLNEGAFVGVGWVLGMFAIMATLEHLDASPIGTLIAIGAAGLLSLVPLLLSRTAEAPRYAWSISLGGSLGLATLCFIGWVSLSTEPVFGAWSDLGEHGLAVAVALLAAQMLAGSGVMRFGPGLYAGWGLIVPSVWLELQAFNVSAEEAYLVPLGLYVLGAGMLYASRDTEREVPLATDIAAMGLIVGIPTLLGTPPTYTALDHALWAFGFSLLAIVIGVLGRVRVYFFAGVIALVWTTFWRSWAYLLEFWWVTLGLIGIAMLVVALTWERQRVVVTGAQQRLQDTFSSWR